jgi:hypothetical protein
VKIFAVRFLSGARQRGSLPCVFSIAHGKQKALGKKLFAVRFYISARQTNSLPCVFWVAHGKLFFPTHRYICYLIRRLCRALLKNARQRYMFAVRQRKTHGKDICLPCVLPQRTAKYFQKNCFLYIF